MKRFVLVLALLSALLLVACGGEAETAVDTAPAEAEESSNIEEASEPEAEEMTTDPEQEDDLAETSEEEEAPAEEDTSGEEAEPVVGLDTYTIVSEETTVRFELWEVLLGEDFLVIATTTGASGSVTVDFADPANSSVNNLTVNITGLASDNNNRNRNIHGGILDTANYPVVTFEQTGISGLPETAEVGGTYDFQLTGNLTIKDVTNEVTFDATMTIVSANRIEGSATTTVLYPDFGVNIPRLPSQVASVQEDVVLVIDFVATK